MCIRASRSVACILLITTSASADYVRVTTVNPDDPDIEFLCTQGNGDFLPGPLTVCDVFATFDDPDDRLLSVGNADLQVFNGAIPDVFFQHAFNMSVTSSACGLITLFPDLVCDSFITLGVDCAPPPPDSDGTSGDGGWEWPEFKFNGRAVGGWLNARVATIPCRGCPADVNDDGELGQLDIALLLGAWGPCTGCPADLDDDGEVGPGDLAILLGFVEFASEQGLAGNSPDLHVLFLRSTVMPGHSMSGHIDIFWKDGDTGEVFVEADVPIECAATCESVDGMATLCHIPPGNPDNAHTITVSINALPAHLAHGDSCGPCEEDDGLLLMARESEVCSADVNGDGQVEAFDLAILLGAWGPCEGCPADFDGDGDVDAADLAQLLGAWGMCR